MSDHLLILGRQGIPVAQTERRSLGIADPFGAGRHIAFQDATGFSTGHVDLAGRYALSDLASAELMVIVAGSIAVDGALFSQGEALVLPKGFTGHLTLAVNTRWFFCTMTAGDRSAERNVIRLDAGLARPGSPGPAPEVVIGTPPSCHALNLFTDPSAMRAGVWDVTTPCERGIVPHRVHELMHLIEGEVTLTHQNGAADVIGAGDTIFLPRGSPYAWRSVPGIVKYYCVL